MIVLFYFLMLTSAASLMVAMYFSIKDMYKHEPEPKKECTCYLADDHMSTFQNLICDCHA